MDPHFQTSAWNVLPELDKELYILHQVYGYDSFTEGQLEDIQRKHYGRKGCFNLIPTVGGKSIIYTVSALLMQGLTSSCCRLLISEFLLLSTDEAMQKSDASALHTFLYSCLCLSHLTDENALFAALVVKFALHVFRTSITSLQLVVLPGLSTNDSLIGLSITILS